MDVVTDDGETTMDLVTPDFDTDADTDTDADSDTDSDIIDPPPPWDPGLVDTEDLGLVRGWSLRRGLIHVHSLHSHDACDGDPWLENGDPNEDCLQDFRDGVCTTRQDVVFLTEHEETAARVDFEDLLLQRGDDVLIYQRNAPIGNSMACPDGRRTLLLAGGEFDVMPVGMERHIGGTPEFREDFYNLIRSGRVDRLQEELGAVVLQAHTESKSIARLRELGLDGFEIYNLHANIDPGIREEYLGLEPWGFTQSLQPFLLPNGPHPDLALLSFLAPNGPALEAFDTLLSEDRHLVGTGGNDAHRNALNIPTRDGERVDSYRRMMRFVTHHFLVQEFSPWGFKDALRSGRFHVVFETIGSPVGLDFHAESDGAITEMGDRAARGSTLRVALPRVHGHEDEDVPMQIKLIRAQRGGGVTVAESVGEDLSHVAEEPGAYRVEIWVTPTHLAPWLGANPSDYIVPTIWVYSNPVYVN
jgi:hypothetical protein